MPTQDDDREPDDGSTPRRKIIVRPTPREKVTPEDLEQRLEGWRLSRAEKTPPNPEESSRMGRRVVMGILGLGMLGVVIGTGVSQQNYEASSAANQEKIAALQNEKDEVEDAAVPEDPGIGKELADLNDAAAHDAKKVASLQHDYAGLTYAAATSKDQGNGGPTKEMQAIVAHRKSLASYFAKDSFLAKDSDAYTWKPMAPFDETTEIDPRWPWYVRQDETSSVAKAGTYDWTVESVMPSLDEQTGKEPVNTATVVWSCRDTKSDALLASASATYTKSGKKGSFSDLSVTTMQTGVQQ